MGEQEKLERINRTMERLNNVLLNVNSNWKNMTYVINKLVDAWEEKLHEEENHG